MDEPFIAPADLPDDVVDQHIASKGPTVLFPVMCGNGLRILEFDRREFYRAKVGDRLSLVGGGLAQRVAGYEAGWNQWRWIPPTLLDQAVDAIAKPLRRLGSRLAAARRSRTAWSRRR